MQELIQKYQQQHQAQPVPADSRLSQIRQQGLARLGAVGFPTTRDENWRYTNTRQLLKQAFKIVDQDESNLGAKELEQFAIDGLESLRFILVNGVLKTDLSAQSLPEGLNVSAMSWMLENNAARVAEMVNRLLPESTHGFMELNTAFLKHGIWLEVDEGVEVAQPIELVFVSTAGDNALVQPRNMFIAGAKSKLRVIERYVSVNDNRVMTNAISEIHVHSAAEFEHTRVQQESASVNHISGTFMKLGENARLSTSTITLGGNLTRNDLRCQISETGSHANLYGLYAANKRQHVDSFTQVEHQVAGCTSDELYKGVLDDRARAVFHGRIYVAQDAQQTDAYQNNRTLLLSRDAEIDTKPQLEIYADDVKCSHGATVGQLNEEYLFYLRSRGVDEAKARRMLTFAFVREALEAITIEPLKVYLENQLDGQLQKGGHYGD